jgi:histidinol-phosphate aminotransferase
MQRIPGFEVSTEIPEKIKMTFLCSPNNPTGNSLSEETVRAIVESAEGIVFLDEAYAEFAEKSLLKLAGQYENLVVGRTLSKAFGLAGMRLGYAVASPWLGEQYRRIAPLFAISSLSLAAGAAALQDLEHMNASVIRIIRERERMRQRISASPSQGNFLYIQTEERSISVVDRLMRQGVVVRECSAFLGTGEHGLRVSVGTPEENDRFLEAYGSG